MKARGKKLLAAMLSLAMVLSMFVMPASAADPQPGEVGYSVDFSGFKDKGTYSGASMSMYMGLTLSEGVRAHDNGYADFYEDGAYILVPVSGECVVEVLCQYGAAGTVGVDSDTVPLKNNNDGKGENAAYHYTGPGGNNEYVKIARTSADGNVYVRSITIKEYNVTPTLKLDKESVVVKMGQTATVTPTVENATMGAVTPTSQDAAVATANGDNGVITINPAAAGKTTVDVSVAISDPADGTTAGPLTASIPVRVLPAEVGTLVEYRSYVFKIEGTDENKAIAEDQYYASGLEWSGLALGNGKEHGPTGGSGAKLTVHIPNGKQTTLTVTTCKYGNGATPTIKNGTLTQTEDNTAEGDNNGTYGKVYTIENAKGAVEITFGGTVYVHSLKVGAFTDATTDPEPGPGDTFEEKTWTFSGTQGSTVPSELEGLKFTGSNIQYHKEQYGIQVNGTGSIEVPVPGKCNIDVKVGYSWNIQLGEDAGTKKASPGTDGVITFYYTGEAGTAVLNIGATSYIKSIKLAAPTDPVPNLLLDKESVTLKMGETETDEVTATVGYSTAAVKAVSKNTDVATVGTVTNGKFTITAVGAGTTTVEVTLDGVTGVKKTIAVTVQAAQTGPVYFAEGTLTFTSSTNLSQIDGFSSTGFAYGSGHGIDGSNDSTITLNLEKKGTVTVTGCCYGQGMTVTSSVGQVEMTTAKDEEEAGKGKAPIAIIKNAEGEVTLTFAREGTLYVHTIALEYAVVAEDRKIDVWDFAGIASGGGEGYVDNITPAKWVEANALGKNEAKGTFVITKDVTFGDLTMDVEADSDRIYSTVEGNDEFKTALGGNFKKQYGNTYADGYESMGGWYCNGTGGDTRRNITIAHVVAGDKIVAYMGSSSGDMTFYFAGQGQAADQNEEIAVKSGAYNKYEFVAQHDGTYKIWTNKASGKPVYHRVVRFPGVNVSGAITIPAGFTATDYTVKFVNQTNKQETEAVVNKAAKTYTATLAPGFTYTVTLSGATGWSFSTDTRTVVTTDAESAGEKTADLVVEAKPVFTYAGTISGFAADFDMTDLVITLVPADPAASDPVELTIDKTAKTFTATLDAGMAYTLEMEGANDYAITAPTEVKLTANAAGETITVEAKGLQDVSGKFLGLGEGVTVTALKFKNVEDNYEYTATVADDGYTAKLRAGAYAAVATVSDTSYTTISHVVVADKAVTKDILFAAPADTSPLTWVKDVYVGYPDKENNYATVNAAVAAVARMGVSSEAKRVTIHIAPGTYREQVIINTPYITLTNDKAGEVLLTWYYGIGYKYYSSTGYYDAQRAFDKYEKKIADRWGTTVRVNKSATGFRAEGITFENSFNRYVTDEEIADGVELVENPENTTVVRAKGVDVTSKAATERAAAMCVETDQAEFFDCSFLSSQDTLYTAGDKNGCQGRMYFKNCYIEGQTDYIFGSGSVVFDECTLNWKGYSETNKSNPGYVTAVRPADTTGCKGYLFRDCTVTANPDLTVAPGFWGRTWGADAMATFLNTRLEKAGLIADEGWKSMNGDPKNANYHEFGTTTLDGAAVDTSKRVEGTVMTEAEANAVTAESYFNGWTPYYYGIETRTVTFQVDTGASVTDLAADGKAAALNSRNQLVALKEAVITFKIGMDDDYTLTGVTGATWENDIYTVNADAVVISTRSNSSSSSGGDMVPTGSSGGKTTTVTNPDGSKTTTKTDRKGNTTVTTVATDGSKVEAVTTKAGDKTITVTNDKGNVQAKVELPAAIPAPEKAFTDVPEGHWAEGAIRNMAGLGTVKGVSDGVFDMSSPITRGSVATILYRLSNVEAKGDNAFTDVDSGDWYAEAVTWAVGTGVVTGYSETLFGPKDHIDRQQFAVMLYRYAQLLKLDTAAQAELKQFQDAANVADWASEAMVWCVDKGILKGNGYGGLNPAGTATRAECAVMLDRFIGLL